jgi:hypothetical protein
MCPVIWMSAVGGGGIDPQLILQLQHLGALFAHREKVFREGILFTPGPGAGFQGARTPDAVDDHFRGE